jgi:hypothetical protein
MLGQLAPIKTRTLGMIASRFLVALSLLLYSLSPQAALTKVTVTSEQAITKAGRLLVSFSRKAQPEPRSYSAWPMPDIEPLFAMDLPSISKPQTVVFDASSQGFPFASIQALPEGEWFVQAIYDTDFLDARINSPHNHYSDVTALTIEDKQPIQLQLRLNQQITAETLPLEQPLLKFVKMKSPKLSAFWDADMYLRAGVILPRTYYDDPLAEFPVIFDIGGYHARYTRAQSKFDDEAFQDYWLDKDTPQMVLVFLDGEAPLGDSYQIDSANNGPYGQATWQEFLPFLNDQFNLRDKAKSRFVTGCSTGGWVSLALQTYYPDTFNGAWSFSADGVDFKYFQLVNIYQDKNALINEHGIERPSYRAKDGEVIFSIKREIMMENQMGRNDSYVYSGGQWGGWNAVFGPKLANGQPSAIWDPNTGEIDRTVAQQWQKYDLRQYTEDNWADLGPKLAGKLHIWMGDMDNFYLNNAMHLYEDMLTSQSQPSSNAKFTWQRGTGHCDYKPVPMLKKIMQEMQSRSDN